MKNNLIKQDDEENILSDDYHKFITDNTITSSILNVNQPRVPELFRDYEYPVSTWPVLIDSDKADKLNKLCTRLPKLLHQIPHVYFKNNISDIANFYFKGDQVFAEYAMMCHKKDVEVGCRLDLAYTNEGFKVLEANIGSAIGGWQVQSFKNLICEMHENLRNPITTNNYIAKDTQRVYIKFVVDKILEYVKDITNEVNVYTSFTHIQDDTLKKKGVEFINDLLIEELKSRNLSGKAFTGDVSSLTMINNKLFLGNTHIHSVLILSLKADNITSDIIRAFITGKIYLPDHLGIPLVSDKRNLGLLRELALKETFCSEDNSLILDFIPWTVDIEESKTVFKNIEYDLIELLRKDREKFVIKDFNGFQGKDVFIGKFSTFEEWEKAIELALTSGKFIAQEFSDSLNFSAPNISNEWTSHKLIWGAFGFGDEYGGVWVRMSEVKTDVGVINSATGAVEAIVFEKRTFS